MDADGAEIKLFKGIKLKLSELKKEYNRKDVKTSKYKEVKNIYTTPFSLLLILMRRWIEGQGNEVKGERKMK